MAGDWSRYERTSPIRTQGGIKAQSRRGQFGESWWSRRWIEVLESFEIGTRLKRGQSYARRGQVLAVEIHCGKVQAKVQGSQPTPYNVTMEVKPLTADEWKRVGTALSGEALYAARLLAAEMPRDIETLFQQAHVSLFPESMGEIKTDCSCPDWSNPCKHIAAVYYLLGEEFDRDPFLIFKLRGLDREALVALIGAPAARRVPAAAAAPAPEPIAPSPGSFWRGTNLPEGLYGEVRTPPVDAPLLRRLGGFPFWRGEEPVLDSLLPVYRAGSRKGMEVFLSEMQSGDGEPGEKSGE